MTEQERQGKTIARMANDLLDWFTKNSLTDYLKGVTIRTNAADTFHQRIINFHPANLTIVTYAN